MNRDYGTNKTEQSILKRMGAKANRNSGRGTVKGDGRWHNFTVDVKEFKKSFTLNASVWSKICTDSIKNRGTDPMLLLVMDGQTHLAVVELSVLEQLLEDQHGNAGK